MTKQEKGFKLMLKTSKTNIQKKKEIGDSGAEQRNNRLDAIMNPENSH